MPFEWVVSRTPYEGCQASLEEARVVLVGAGYDGTTSYRPGSRFAPQAIRAEVVYSQENYSPYLHRDLTDRAIHDLGDVNLPFGTREVALDRIYRTARQIFELGKIPCFIGGEHLITLPIIQAAVEFFPDLVIVQLDAHLDLMDELFGERYSHGTVMRRCYELLSGRDCLHQVAIRSGNRLEYQFAAEHTRLYEFHTRDFLHQIEHLKNRPVYLTVDLDVFDPSMIPGTGTPEAGGIFFPEFVDFLRAMDGTNIVGADLVELSPQLDPTTVSTITAAKILRELLLIL
ncbi:MAG: agmatinase [Calditrichaeota bacterium]|nr:MAG: agmatinase [Calditrichota bacterium]